MRKKQKWFIFNKSEDFSGTAADNLIYSEGVLRLLQPGRKGFFRSGLMDTGEKQTQWNKLIFRCRGKAEPAVRLRFYTFEENRIVWNGTESSVEELLGSSELEDKDKKQALRIYLAKETELAEEVPLYDVTGRYGCLELEFDGLQEEESGIAGILAVFPKYTWAEHLPDLYQQDEGGLSFVERYLGIFQSLHEQMERQINTIPEYLDVCRTGEEYLKWIARRWLAFPDSFLWSGQQLRELTARAVLNYRRRGTVGYLKEILREYAGVCPHIVEHHQLQEYRRDKKKGECLDDLYGENPYIFTVVINAPGLLGQKDIRIIERLVETEKPAWMECNLIVLEPYIFLGWHSYLGMNSILSDYEPLILDGQSSIPFIKLTNRRDGEEGTGE